MQESDLPSHRKPLTQKQVAIFTFIQPVTESILELCEKPKSHGEDPLHSYQWFLISRLIAIVVGLGPLIVAPLSEVCGRKPVLLGGAIVFIIWNASYGVVDDLDKMIAFRLLSGLGGCAADTVAGGVIADLWAAEQRGRVYAVFIALPLIGPGLGGVLAVFVSEGPDWRWVSWTASAVAAAFTAVSVLLLHETYLPKIEQEWYQKQRKTIRTTNSEIPSPNRAVKRDTGPLAPSHGQSSNYGTLSTSPAVTSPQTVEQAVASQSAARSPSPVATLIVEHPSRQFIAPMRVSLRRPLHMLLTERVVQVLVFYMAMIYSIMFHFLDANSHLWSENYGQSNRIASLNHISVLLGLVLGVNIAGQAGDRTHQRLTVARNGGIAKPEFRLPIMIFGTALMPIGLLCWGWSGQQRTHWIVPNLGSMLFSTGIYICIASVSVYTIDVYHKYAASAMATNLVVKSMAGALFPFFTPYLFDKLGLGMGATVLAGASLAVGSATLALLW